MLSVIVGWPSVGTTFISSVTKRNKLLRKLIYAFSTSWKAASQKIKKQMSRIMAQDYVQRRVLVLCS
jgi:short subunit dehydrogenase-like uncharacterized protein